MNANGIRSTSRLLSPLDSYVPPAQINKSGLAQIQESMSRQKELQLQKELLMQELKAMEMQSELDREQKVLNLINYALSKKRVKKVPPPLAELPYALVPKNLIKDLGI